MDQVLPYLASHPLELVTICISLVWLVLEYRASIWLWPVGIILPLLWLPIAWEARLYGMLAINVYYLVTSAWGWFVWLRRRPSTAAEELPITDIPRRTLGWTLLLSGPLYGLLIALGTNYLPEWRIPWADGLLTVSSIVGMIWMGRKWRQHWLCWIVANAAGIISLWAAEDYLSMLVYLTNFVVSFFGYRKWSLLMKEQDATTAAR